MSSSDGHERRRGLRAPVAAQMYFNQLDAPEEYVRGQAPIVKKLAALNTEKTPQPQTDVQIFLSRIDRKLSLILSIMAERHNRKTYLNQATILDISEFGLGFEHSTQFGIGSVLEIGLSLPYAEGRLLDLAGQIVRTLPGRNPNFFIHGVEFIDILGSDQNDIVQWIFNRQREEIRRRRDSI